MSLFNVNFASTTASVLTTASSFFSDIAPIVILITGVYLFVGIINIVLGFFGKRGSDIIYDDDNDF